MSVSGKEYRLAIRIAGTIDKSFGASLVLASTSLRKTVGAVNKDFLMLDNGYNKIARFGKRAFLAMGAAAAVAGAAIGRVVTAGYTASVEFESAFAGVKKTVDATDLQFNKLRQDILDMSKEIPSTASEIAGVMEIAGQLGIARESLSDFTKTMINLGVSTNMSANDAATALAKFANIVNMDQTIPENWERLGSVIVDLGNNFATTEEDIVLMSTRLASSADLVGLTEAQILALSTAMSSVGIRTEAGGSTMSKFLKKMQMAVETNSAALADFASVSNMSVAEFSNAFKTDAVGALGAFISGLNDTERNGKSAIAVLNDMKLNEVRLSNTLLALAGSGDLMSRAVETANRAWEENTALMAEAQKRYETVESRTQILKNSMTEMAIAAYDEMRPLIVEVLKELTNGFNDLQESGKLSNFIQNATKGFPTFYNNAKKYIAPAGEMVKSVFGWIMDNGTNIIGIITAIGTAMVAYKVVSNGVKLVSVIMSIASLNPVTIVLLGIVAAVSLLAGAFAKFKLDQKKLADENVIKHFGNLSLSLTEINKVAGEIIRTKNIDKVANAMKAFDDVALSASTMTDALERVNKLNWQVMIGVDNIDKEAYIDAIDQYVNAAKDYALNSQYAVALNLGAIEPTGNYASRAFNKINQYYQGTYEVVSQLGTDLSKAVNDAFSDGILDPNEITDISDIQAKIAKFQSELASNEFEAQMQLINMDYAGLSNLDADTFANMQTALNEQVQAAAQTYKESYAKNYAALKATWDSTNHGGLTTAEYQGALDAIKKNYLDNIQQINIQSAKAQTDAIIKNYGDDLASTVSNVQESIASTIGSIFSPENLDKMVAEPGSVRDYIERIYGEANSQIEILSKEDRLGLGKLFEQLKPQLDQFNALKDEYRTLGEEVPKEITDAINNILAIGAASGNFDVLYQMIGNSLGSNDEYATVVEIAQELGGMIPEELCNAMISPGNMIQIRNNAKLVLDKIEKELEKGIDANIPVNLNIVSGVVAESKKKVYSLPTSYQQTRDKSLELLSNNIKRNAKGGFIRNTTLSWLGEEGPEAVIPLNATDRAVSLWQKAGQILGMRSVMDEGKLSGAGAGASVSYSPTLQFYGDSPSKKDLTDALDISQEKFEQLMNRYNKNRARTSMAY